MTQKSKVKQLQTTNFMIQIGSSDVQIALLTERINHLVEHLKIHKKDIHTRGLLALVSQRHRLQQYLKRKNPERLAELTKNNLKDV